MAAGVRAIFGPCRQVAGLVPRLRDGMSASSRPLAARAHSCCASAEAAPALGGVRVRAHALTSASSPGSVRRVLQLAGLRFATAIFDFGRTSYLIQSGHGHDLTPNLRKTLATQNSAVILAVPDSG